MSIEKKLDVILHELSVIKSELEELKTMQSTDRLNKNRMIETALILWNNTDSKNRS